MKILIKSVIIFFILLLGGFLFLITTHIGGWRGFIVTSSSMEPAIATGSLVITHATSPSTLQEGDIITFVRPNNTKELITHRIATIKQDTRVTIIQTKGDKNPYPDNWTLAGGGVIGKVQVTIPYMGYLLSFTQTKMGILFFILIPAVYIVVSEIHVILNLLGNHKKARSSSGTAKLLIVSFLGISISAFTSTTASLSDSSQLVKSTFVLEQTPVDENCTPTPIKHRR